MHYKNSSTNTFIPSKIYVKKFYFQSWINMTIQCTLKFVQDLNIQKNTQFYRPSTKNRILCLYVAGLKRPSSDLGQTRITRVSAIRMQVFK